MIDFRLVRHFVRQLARGKRFWGMAALSSVAGFIAWISSIAESDEKHCRDLSHGDGHCRRGDDFYRLPGDRGGDPSETNGTPGPCLSSS